MGKISLFSLASPNSFEFYRVDSHHSSAAALASPTALWLSQDSCRSFNPKLTSWNPLKAQGFTLPTAAACSESCWNSARESLAEHC